MTEILENKASKIFKNRQFAKIKPREMYKNRRFAKIKRKYCLLHVFLNRFIKKGVLSIKSFLTIAQKMSKRWNHRLFNENNASRNFQFSEIRENKASRNFQFPKIRENIAPQNGQNGIRVENVLLAQISFCLPFNVLIWSRKVFDTILILWGRDFPRVTFTKQ